MTGVLHWHSRAARPTVSIHKGPLSQPAAPLWPSYCVLVPHQGAVHPRELCVCVCARVCVVVVVLVAVIAVGPWVTIQQPTHVVTATREDPQGEAACGGV